MRTTLTDTFLRSAKRKPLEEHYDAHGLVIRMGKKRSQWAIRTRPAGADAYTRKPIGYFPAMSLAEARAIAAEHAHRRLHNIPENDVHVRVPGTVLTLGNLIDRYEKARHKSQQDIKSLKPCMAVLRNGFKKYTNLDMAAFKRADMREAHDEMSSNGRLANGNLFLRYASAMFNWAIYEELMDTNWASGKFVKRAKIKPRDRVLSMDELAAIWQATVRYAEEGSDQGRASRHAYGRMIRFLMLTGQRISEAADLRYGDIVTDLWTQTVNKMDRTHRLRLPELALAEVDVASGKLGHRVFTSQDGHRLNNFDVRMGKLHELSGVTGWSAHTLRHTLVSQLGAVGVSLEVREAVINHKLVGMAGVYNHVDHAPAMRAALKQWADMIEAKVVENRHRA